MNEITPKPLTADGWSGYSEDDLTWLSANYGATPWAVHVIGPDDIHTHVNPELDDDDPANPPHTEATARAAVAEIERIDREYAEKCPDPDGYRPVLYPVLLHHGVPFDSDQLMAEPLTIEDTDAIRRVRDYLHVHVRTHGVTGPIAVIDESGEPGGHRWVLTAEDLGRALVAGNRHTSWEGMKALRAEASPTVNDTRDAWDVFADIAAITTWLDDANPATPHEDAMRLMKLFEEAGEVCEAYIGMTGQNPRKGITHTRYDVLAELADVAITALCAMQHFTQDPAATRGVLAAKVAGIMARSDIRVPQPSAARATDGGVFERLTGAPAADPLHFDPAEYSHIVVDGPNAEETWTAQQWNDYIDACKDPKTGGQIIFTVVRLIAATGPATRTCTACDGTGERRDFNTDGDFESSERCGACDSTGRVATDTGSVAAK